MISFGECLYFTDSWPRPHVRAVAISHDDWNIDYLRVPLNDVALAGIPKSPPTNWHVAHGSSLLVKKHFERPACIPRAHTDPQNPIHFLARR